MYVSLSSCFNLHPNKKGAKREPFGINQVKQKKTTVSVDVDFDSGIKKGLYSQIEVEGASLYQYNPQKGLVDSPR